MNVISLKGYAKNNNISYEAVRQQVVRYASELEGHIIKDGRQQFLDEEAVTFLDEKRKKNPVIIYQASKDEEIERLEEENKALLIKLAQVQEQLLGAQSQVAQLKDASVKVALLEADNAAAEQRRAEAEERANVAEQERKSSEETLEQMRREAQLKAVEAQAAEEQRIEAERLLVEREAELEELRNAGFLKRVFGWKKQNH